ncbi:SWIM zinc finger family protein [Streptosporangium sp. NPDC000239]|uniref:SWIM zinc finger family protein n=1 Tax=unclassified Streptosporangium TaxID=2632669 RepID=UPI0033309757
MIERWNRDQVLALAPDAPSRKAAQGVSSPGKWSGAGATAEAVWGECAGSGSKPYRACVDLSEPAYRCSCPSRKFPCKHALGLLLLWSADAVPAAEEPADWVGEWLDQRRTRAEKAATAATSAAEGGKGKATPDPRRAEQREQRVSAGLAELELWLADQVRQGIAGSRRHDHWDDLVKRLVDAQAPGVAGTVSRLGDVLAGEDWPARLLGEYSLLHLLSVAHRRMAATQPYGAGHGGGEGDGGGLVRTVRDRIGFPVAKEEVLAEPTVRDVWDVLGRRDSEQDRLITRRVWLRGRNTGRAALVLSHAPVGQALDASLVTGVSLDAELAFYPGSAPLRALVAARHDGAVPVLPPAGRTPGEALEEVARALAGDPWLDSWPVVLREVTPMTAQGKTGSWLLGGPDSGPDGGPDSDPKGGPGAGLNRGLPLHPSAGTPWRLVAVSGGRPLTVAAEWTPRGLLPLTTWDDQGRVIVL